MSLVHYVKGCDSKSALISGDIVRVINLVYTHEPKTREELLQLCCKNGVCPVVLSRSGFIAKKLAKSA